MKYSVCQYQIFYILQKNKIYDTDVDCGLSPGKSVLIVNGAYRGQEAILQDMNEKKFSCTVSIKSVNLVSFLLEKLHSGMLKMFEKLDLGSLEMYIWNGDVLLVSLIPEHQPNHQIPAKFSTRKVPKSSLVIYLRNVNFPTVDVVKFLLS